MFQRSDSTEIARRTGKARPCVWLAVIIAICFGVASGTYATNSDTTPTPLSEKQGRVLPDNEGAISEILLHYDPVCAKELAPLYRDLFRQLEPDIRIKVVCPSKAAVSEFFSKWGVAAAGNGRDVRILNVNLPVSVWARDRCIARQGLDPNDPVSCFVPARMRAYEIEKDNDRRASVIMWAASLGPQPMMSTLQLEGGNVVANRDQVFIGANVLAQNLATFSPDALAAELHRICGPDVILVQDRNGQAPWCHVDMYITPLDDSTMLVGSIEMADAILDNVPADRRQVNWMLSDKDSPDCESDMGLDDVASQMETLGYNVQRLPIVAETVDEWMITYNNVLIDRRGDRRIVYMPIYHVPSLDAAAAALYRSFGFEVRRIDVSLVHKYGGAIRCVVNVTQRKPLLPSIRSGGSTIGTVRPQRHSMTPDAGSNQPTRSAEAPQLSIHSSL